MNWKTTAACGKKWVWVGAECVHTMLHENNLAPRRNECEIAAEPFLYPIDKHFLSSQQLVDNVIWIHTVIVLVKQSRRRAACWDKF